METYLDHVEGWLRAGLAKRSYPAAHILAVAERNGFSTRTLRRAKKRAGVESYRRGGHWWWKLASLPKLEESHG